MTQMEDYIFSQLNPQNLYESVQQQIDDANTMSYDPKLFLFQVMYTNESRLFELNITKEMRYYAVLTKLKAYINPANYFPIDIQNDAQYFYDTIRQQKPDLQNFFNSQFNFITQKLQNYSSFLDQVDLQNLQHEQYIQINDENKNIFQFIVNGTKSEEYDLHFTSPVPLQKLSKDVVFLINDFQDSHSVLKTFHESASVYDRIWFFQVTGETKYRNLIQLVYGRDYVSLQAALNAYKLISVYIEQHGLTSDYTSSSIVQQILNLVIQSTAGTRYIVTQNNKTNKYTANIAFEIILFMFGKDNILYDILYEGYQKGNVNIFFIKLPLNSFSEQFLATKECVYLDYTSQDNFINIQLPKIVKRLNQLFVSSGDEIGSVNDSVIIARALFDKNNEYVGMLLVKPNVFRTFSDVIMNNLDGLSGTTLKIRMMEQQRSILNPFYQFMPSISYIGGTPEPLIQTTPCQLNDYAQIQFNEALLSNRVKMVKMIDVENNQYIENMYGVYQMQLIRKEFTINIGLSSTAFTTRTRFPYSTENCIQPTNTNIVIKEFNISSLRQFTAIQYKRKTKNCLVMNGAVCTIKDDAQLSKIIKQKIVSEFNPLIPTLCSQKFTSSKFQLYLDSDNYIEQMIQTPQFGNMSNLKQEYDILKQAIIDANQTIINTLRLKYMNYVPIKQSEFSQIDHCILVEQNQQFSSISKFSSLINLQTTSPLLLLGLLTKSIEIMHFARFVNTFEYLLNNPLIKSIYLGHTWISGDDINYANILEQQNELQKIGNDADIIKINNMCLSIARFYNTHYFMFSTNQSNNAYIQNEQIKSNSDGGNNKFRLSIVNDSIFLTKPILTKNKSLINTPNVQAYLTIEIDQNQLDEEKTDFIRSNQFVVMDPTGSIVVDNNISQEISLGIKTILINQGYLTETTTNATIQNSYKSCSRNNDFWETAFQRSTNGEFILVVSRNDSRFSSILTENDYNSSAMFKRTVIFNASSEFFLSGYLVVQEFSVLNEFIVVLKDVVVSNLTKQEWQYSKQIDYQNHLKHTTQNISELDYLYPNLTFRSIMIEQSIQRYLPNQNLYSSQIFQQIVILIYVSPLIVLIYFIMNNSKNKQFVYNIPDSEQCYQLTETSSNRYISMESDQATPITNTNIQTSVQIRDFSLYFLNYKYVFEQDNQICVQDIQQLKLLQNNDVDHQLHVFQLIFNQQIQCPNFKSFDILCSQQQYSQMTILLKSLDTWIPRCYLQFNSNIKIYKAHTRGYFQMPTRRMYTRNIRYVSNVASYIQTKLPSIQESQCPSRQELEFDQQSDELPPWFDDSSLYFVRDLEKPNNCIINIEFTQNFQKFCIQQIIQLSISE
ncbi:Conserved_hypothetical protein [Hexamita inflata]|uniref:Transmembrane protein n=1 Tax=Hexamita inflata TaxID=28002 RepID=A0AA86UX36_9EUKA|nr:Conserved hypothetical protein [Hexamita inflata]